MSPYYTATIMIAVASMIVMEICVSSNDMMYINNKKVFSRLYLMIICASLFEWMGNLMQGVYPALQPVHIMVKCAELCLVPFIPLEIARVFTKSKRLTYCFWGAGIHAVLVFISTFAGFIFYVDAANVYHHGTFYWIYVVAYLSAYVVCFVAAIKYVIRYQYQGSAFVIGIFLFFMFGMIATMVIDGIQIDFVVLAVASIMIYIVNSDAILQTDSLTGLINRMGYDSYTQQIKDSSIVLFFDLDDFKRINDTFGHAYGDRCLIIISRLILKRFRGVGKCFRIGGDEFCVIMNGDYTEAAKQMHLFAMDMDAVRKKEKNLPYVSIGYSQYDPINGVVTDSVKEADEMMYKFKKMRKEGQLKTIDPFEAYESQEAQP